MHGRQDKVIKSEMILSVENMLEKRVVYIDHVSPRPHALENLTAPATVESGFFPRIETSIMNVEISQQS